jgi:hypothetical protein
MGKDITARSFVTIMLTIAIVSLILRFGIAEGIKIVIHQNESNAQSNLKLVAAALENYAKDHLGTYPSSLGILCKGDLPYLDKDFMNESFIQSYGYVCNRMDPTGYSCSAIPMHCKITGNKVFTISTGGVLVSEECKR